MKRESSTLQRYLIKVIKWLNGVCAHKHHHIYYMKHSMLLAVDYKWSLNCKYCAFSSSAFQNYLIWLVWKKKNVLKTKTTLIGNNPLWPCLECVSVYKCACNVCVGSSFKWILIWWAACTIDENFARSIRDISIKQPTIRRYMTLYGASVEHCETTTI